MHAHHALHLIIARHGQLEIRGAGEEESRPASGLLTAPGAEHAVDARGAEVLIVFLDPESEAGISLRKLIPGALRLLTEAECVRLRAGADPARIMRAGGA
ncbi:MAG TPA: hypothetical protein VFQ61_30080, partial [Polyangiaceae bacterium]|nr:hypothetical protein [Polyangiaceae bacterium]